MKRNMIEQQRRKEKTKAGINFGFCGLGKGNIFSHLKWQLKNYNHKKFNNSHIEKSIVYV